MWLMLLFACDLVDAAVTRGVGHCDLRESSVSAQPYCQEWRGMIESPGSDATPTAVCASLDAPYDASECPDPDLIVAGCFIGKLGDGSGSYHWYYGSAEAPLTADDVRAECGSDEFVEYFEYDPDADDFGPP